MPNDSMFCAKCGNKLTSSSESSSTKLFPYDWCMVLVLFISYFLSYIFNYLVTTNQLDISIDISNIYKYEIALYFVLNTILLVLDDIQLRKIDKKAPSAFLGLFLVPVYLLMRSYVVKKHAYSFWVWLIIFAISLTIDFFSEPDWNLIGGTKLCKNRDS